VTDAERLRDGLQRLERELGRLPELSDILEREECPDISAFTDAFGSWYSALWEAGFTPANPPSYWSKADIEVALQALGDAPDDPPVTADLEQSRIYPSLTVVNDRFGSWEAALEAAGYEMSVNTRRKWSEKQLLDDLEALADSVGRKPKAIDVANRPEMASPRTYDKVFGSWNAALEAAGFSPTPVGTPRTHSDEELITALQSVAAELNRQPRLSDVEAHEESPSPGVFIGRFGTWADVLAAAGIETEMEGSPQYTDSDLLDALRTLAERVDRIPRISDLKEFDDLPAPATYYRRFDSFTEALELSGVNSEN
jgi:hypothetical protein